MGDRPARGLQAVRHRHRRHSGDGASPAPAIASTPRASPTARPASRAQDPETVNRNLGRLFSKLERHRELIDSWEALQCEDADVVIVAIGISSRAARRAIDICRDRRRSRRPVPPHYAVAVPGGGAARGDQERPRRAGARTQHRPASASRSNGCSAATRSRACINSAASRSRPRRSPRAPPRWHRRPDVRPTPQISTFAIICARR